MNKILILCSITLLSLGSFYTQKMIYAIANPSKTPPPTCKMRSEVEEEGFDLNKKESQLVWKANYVLGGEQKGLLIFEAGNFIIADKENIKAGNFTLDMNSIQNADIQAKKEGDEGEKHLKSPDFLAVSTQSKAQFEITKTTSLYRLHGFSNTYNVMIEGRFTFKGVSNLISFIATVTRNQSTVKTQAEFTIDRTKWGSKCKSYDFFSNLKDEAISNEIKINLNLVFFAGC